MAGIESAVLADFFARLTESDVISQQVVEGLKSALGSDKPPKAEDLANLFSTHSGDASA